MPPSKHSMLTSTQSIWFMAVSTEPLKFLMWLLEKSSWLQTLNTVKFITSNSMSAPKNYLFCTSLRWEVISELLTSKVSRKLLKKRKEPKIKVFLLQKLKLCIISLFWLRMVKKHKPRKLDGTKTMKAFILVLWLVMFFTILKLELLLSKEQYTKESKLDQLLSVMIFLS